MPMNSNSLDIFDIITRSWFVRALGKPTAVQEEAWPAILQVLMPGISTNRNR